MTTDFETGFRPTDEQITYAKKYLDEAGLGSLLMAVSFPGKRHGIWEDGQVREAVLDGDTPVIWTDRTSALYALDSGKFGNALFRVYADGYFHLVDEV